MPNSFKRRRRLPGAAAGVLAVLAVGCARPPEAPSVSPDPPLVAMYALPLAGQEGSVAFTDEYEAFEWARQAYVQRGWPEAGGIPLELDTHAAIPFASDGTIVSPPFIGPEQAMTEHLAVVSTAFYRGELHDYADSFEGPAEARAAYDAFMLAMLLHELAHAIAQVRDVSEDNAYLEEMRAIDFEVAIAADLVATGQLPPRWMDDYEAFNRVLLEAAPPGLLDELPTEPQKRRLAFMRHYKLMNEHRVEAITTGRNPAQDSADRVLAMYTEHRLARVKAPPALADLESALEHPDLDVHFETVLEESLIPYERNGPMFRFQAGPARYVVRFNRRNVFFRGDMGLTVPPERRGAVLEFANLAYSNQVWGRFELEEDGTLVFFFAEYEMSNFDAVSKIRRGTEVVDRWRLDFATVIAGQEAQAVFDARRAKQRAEAEAADARLEEAL
ncbi:MAG: hypothetical protein AAF799_37175 [Myxococcota bacterium]